VSGGKHGPPEAHLTTGVPCLPVMPVVEQVAAALQINTPFEVMETYVDDDIDVEEGDYATIDGLEYEVFAVGDWPWVSQQTIAFKHLILRQVKGRA